MEWGVRDLLQVRAEPRWSELTLQDGYLTLAITGHMVPSLGFTLDYWYALKPSADVQSPGCSPEPLSNIRSTCSWGLGVSRWRRRSPR